MANNNQLELVVTVEVDKANQSIKSVNANLSGIEAAATKSARAASGGIDGMTASMVKGATAGNLLADAIKKAIDTVKEWTIDAAKQAAQEDRAAIVTRALAKAHGDGAAAAQKAVEAIREVGYTTADATTSVQKLIIADIGLDKAKGLAKIAKDASAVSTEGIGAAEAFEKIMLAIETGQSRGLRTLSLFPDLAKAEEVARLQAELHGKTLSENEVKQIRYNAIVEASKKIQDANAAAAGTVAGQMKAMGREVEELKDDIGKTFQDELKAVVGLLRGMVSFFGEHTDAISKFAKGTLVLAGIIATITAATKAWALAQGALNLAMAVNPAFLLAGGIIGAGAIIYKEYSDMKEGMDARYKQMETDALRKDVGSGKVKIADLRKRGMTDDQIRDLISGRKAIPGEESPWGDLGAGLPKIRIAGQPDPEDLKLQLEIRKKQRENAEYFKDQSIAANGAGKTGYAKDVADMNAEIARRTKFTDDKGTHAVPLTKSAWDSIIDTMQKKFQAFKDHFALENKKTLADYLKDEDEKHQKEMEYEAKRYQERLKNDVDIAEKNLDHLRTVYAFEEQRAGFERDARLRQVESLDPQTLQQKIAVEQQKAAIEIDYLEKVHEVKQALYDMDARRMLLEEELNLTQLKYKADEIKARIEELKGATAGDPRPGRRGQRRRDPRGPRERSQPHDAVGARAQPANLRLAQAAGGRRVRRAPHQIAVGVEGHRQLPQDRAPDCHQGGRHVAGRGHADVHVHRPEGDVCWRAARGLAVAAGCWAGWVACWASARHRCLAGLAVAAGRSLAARRVAGALLRSCRKAGGGGGVPDGRRRRCCGWWWRRHVEGWRRHPRQPQAEHLRLEGHAHQPRQHRVQAGAVEAWTRLPANMYQARQCEGHRRHEGAARSWRRARCSQWTDSGAAARSGVAETTGGRRYDRREVRRSIWARCHRRVSPGSQPGWCGCSSKARSRRPARRSRICTASISPTRRVLQQIVDTAKQSYGGQPRHGDPDGSRSAT